MTTPIRTALVDNSALHALVKDGLGAIEGAHRAYIEEVLRPTFADSLDIDKAFHKGHEQEHRWDYLLGHAPTRRLVALEPHTANDKNVKVVIAKRAASREHLRAHLKSKAVISDWFWVASGKVDFTAMDKTEIRLSQNGIRFVGKQLLTKLLPSPSTAAGTPKPGKRKPA